MWWKIAIGSTIVLLTLEQMFLDLFHPTHTGALSDFIGDKLFRAFRRWPPLLGTAGPLTVVVVIFLWALLLATGFTFIYWSAFPSGFQLRTANGPTASDSFVWCFYYSLEMLTTLGLGDIVPSTNWLRVLSVIHTLIGFSMLTASLTWILLLFPALSHARTLARKTGTFLESEQATGVALTATDMHIVILLLVEEVLQVRVNLVHFPILFFFYAPDPISSLPNALCKLKSFAERGRETHRDDTMRFSCESLSRALDQLASILAPKLDAHDQSTEAIFNEFASLHSPRA